MVVSRSPHIAALGTTAAPPAQVLARLVSEYDALPGLRLTTRQAGRICGLDDVACESVLRLLVSLGYLDSTPAGYVRAHRVVRERGLESPLRHTA